MDETPALAWADLLLLEDQSQVVCSICLEALKLEMEQVIFHEGGEAEKNPSEAKVKTKWWAAAARCC